MEYKSENKICQNCNSSFTIEPDDFSFYEKIKVPLPTFCPWCRFIRRMALRNERSLYKRICDLCHKNIIATYSTETLFPVYCWTCWHGDGWNSSSYAREYDFSRPFFEQYKELLNSVPRFAMWQRNAINSDYATLVGESKNVYLSVSVVLGSEDIFYSKAVDASTQIFDSYNIKSCEQCYENIEGVKNYNSQNLLLSKNCIDSYFLIDCSNCSNCFMSSNLRNKQYHIRNQKYTKEEYEKVIISYCLGSRRERKKFLDEYKSLRECAIYRFANMIQTHTSTGNGLLNTKNCLNCFDCYDGENFKYCYRAFKSKDAMDYDFGHTSELMYEYSTGASSDYNVRFSYAANGQVRDIEYCNSILSSSNLFGCVGMRNKEYAILNKIYSKTEFTKLREKIIKHMEDMPYFDKKGIVYRYGEFFPIELSVHAYNESPAQDFAPLTKEEVRNMGYNWKDDDIKNNVFTVPSDKIPDDIKEVSDSILKEVMGCKHEAKCNHQCAKAFRIAETELQFYKKHNIPLPDMCANCRYYERFEILPMPKLYKRTCMKCNKVEFETSYAPDRPEKVYCESCYNKEVY